MKENREFATKIETRDNSKKEYCNTKPEQGNIIVKALCKNDKTSFVDTFYVKNSKTAEKEVIEMINWFNSTLRPYELPRRLVKIESIEEEGI